MTQPCRVCGASFLAHDYVNEGGFRGVTREINGQRIFHFYEAPPAVAKSWTTKAARKIAQESMHQRPSEERIAAIIATFAGPLVALLQESKREHQWDEDDKCDKLNKIDPAEKVCTCGTDAWNARVNAALNGEADHD